MRAGSAALIAVFLLIASARDMSAQTPAQTPSEAEKAKIISQSNNPLSDLIGFNANEYYAGSLYSATGVGNLMNLQAVIIPVKKHEGLRHLIRATMPLETTPDTPTSYASGFGDFVIQDAFKFSKAGATTEWGVGPMLVAPTATADALGTGKWQIGVAAVVVQQQDEEDRHEDGPQHGEAVGNVPDTDRSVRDFSCGPPRLGHARAPAM